MSLWPSWVGESKIGTSGTTGTSGILCSSCCTSWAFPTSPLTHLQHSNSRLGSLLASGSLLEHNLHSIAISSIHHVCVCIRRVAARPNRASAPSKHPVSRYPTVSRRFSTRTQRRRRHQPVDGSGQSMNSLSALANIGTPTPSPPRSRTGSQTNLLEPRSNDSRHPNDASATIAAQSETGKMGAARSDGSGSSTTEAVASEYDEKVPLLSEPSKGPFEEAKPRRRWLYPQRLSNGIIAVVGVLATPFVYTGQYLVACFHYGEDGHFSLLAPVYHITQTFTRGRRKKVRPPAARPSASGDNVEKRPRKSRNSSVAQPQTKKTTRRSLSIASTSTAMTSDSESERPPTRDGPVDSPSRHTRSKSNASSGGDEIAPAKRLIRIKLHNEDELRQRKAAKKVQTAKSNSVSPEAAASLKSPTGPVTASSKQLTRFPRAPQPPRPLVPRRQPSYSASGTSAIGPHQKTLIIDLDETLIHSIANGGRFQTGHMVEVKLQAAVGANGQIIGPQVPLLYYVHKRPHCDDFLKKVTTARPMLRSCC
jgi:CTD nuclear envelope phosphatase 1